MKIARLKTDGELILKGELIESAKEDKIHFLSFDGVDDTIDNIGVNNFNWNEGTWEFWIRTRTDFSSLPTNYYESLFGVEQLSPSFRLRVYARGSASFYFTFVSRGGDVRFPISRLTKDEWHHIAITYSAINGQMESYIDGIRASTSSFAYSDVALNSSFNIGKTMAYNNFNGDMKEFRVWNKALTQTEIQENMNKSLTGNEEGLVSYLPMTEIEENILTDKSSNSNDGIINGATFIEDNTITNEKITFDNDGDLFTTIELIEKENPYYLSFDGVDDYVEIPNSAEELSFTDNFTISAWKYFDGANGGYQDPIISKAHGSWGAQQYDYTFNGGIHSVRNDSYMVYCILSLGNINNGRFHNITTFFIPIESLPIWLHYTAVYEKGDIHKTHTFVHDEKGNLISQSTLEISNEVWAGITPGNYNVNFSKSPRSNNVGYGGLKDVKIWERALEQSEIEDNLFRKLIGDEIGLKAYWSLDEWEGDIVIDRANSGFDVVIHGATWKKEDFKFRLSNNKVLVSELIEGGV